MQSRAAIKLRSKQSGPAPWQCRSATSRPADKCARASRSSSPIVTARSCVNTTTTASTPGSAAARNAMSTQLLQDERGDVVVVAAEVMTTWQTYRAQRAASCVRARRLVAVFVVKTQGWNARHSLQFGRDRQSVIAL